MAGKIFILGVAVVVLLGILFFAFGIDRASSFETLNSFEEDIKIYKSSSCGCCDVYVDYFKRNGNSNTQFVNLEDVNPFREKYGIPSFLASCHTTLVGNYFIEGHMPLEAIEKLLKEQPDIAGIAMPGMPSGSPGMPGTKTEDFVIFSVNRDGTYQEFMRI